jgi:hypothetical protein
MHDSAFGTLLCYKGITDEMTIDHTILSRGRSGGNNGYLMYSDGNGITRFGVFHSHGLGYLMASPKMRCDHGTPASRCGRGLNNSAVADGTEHGSLRI